MHSTRSAAMSKAKALLLLALVASAAATDTTTVADTTSDTLAPGAPVTTTVVPAGGTTGPPGSSTVVPGAPTVVPGATTPPATGACADRVNAKTGVSDCAAHANLCNTRSYFDFMTAQCPKTCNRCNYVATTPSTCVDAVDDRGVSNCAANVALCTNAVYKALMAKQCPLTCGLCGSLPPGPPAAAAGCVDGTNAKTGASDCARLAYLCNNAAYYTLMTQQCPKTCGRCPTGK